MKNNRIKTILLALLVMALWGSLFPFIKIGYRVFDISANSVPDILMFAGVRFTVSGLAVCLFASGRKEKVAQPKGKSLLWIFIMGLFAIVLHYAFTYIGLATTDGSKTALIKQLGALLYVCLAFLFIKNEKFSVLKIVGALLGFGGIVAINFSTGKISFSPGDLLIIAASVCTVIANIISKKSVEGSSPFWITGFSQLTGGILLLCGAFAMGAKFLAFDGKSLLVFLYICTASVTGYTLWYYVLKNTSLSKLFIIKFTEPLFACVFSAALLGENIFKLQYLVAFVLISLGILLGNKSEKELSAAEK